MENHCHIALDCPTLARLAANKIPIEIGKNYCLYVQQQMCDLCGHMCCDGCPDLFNCSSAIIKEENIIICQRLHYQCRSCGRFDTNKVLLPTQLCHDCYVEKQGGLPMDLYELRNWDIGDYYVVCESEYLCKKDTVTLLETCIYGEGRDQQFAHLLECHISALPGESIYGKLHPAITWLRVVQDIDGNMLSWLLMHAESPLDDDLYPICQGDALKCLISYEKYWCDENYHRAGSIVCVLFQATTECCDSKIWCGHWDEAVCQLCQTHTAKWCGTVPIYESALVV